MEAVFGACSSPIQFAIPTSIDAVTVGGWMADLVKEMREYASRTEELPVCGGAIRTTPRGLPSNQPSGSALAKSSPRFLTISREAKYFWRAMLSWLYTEIFMSILYLRHRAFDVSDLLYLTNTTYSTLTLDINPRSIDPHDGERRQKTMSTWLKSYKIYIERTTELGSESRGELFDLKSMVDTGSFNRFMGKFDSIRSQLSSEALRTGRRRPVAITDTNDVILLRSKDFRYPLDGSWFEIAHMRYRTGQGIARVESMSKTGSNKIVLAMIDRIGKDFSESLMKGLVDVLQTAKQDLAISQSFMSEATLVIANMLVDAAVSYFNFAVAYSSGTSGTTINLRAIKCAFLSMPTNGLVIVTDRMIKFIEQVCIHAIPKK